MLHFASAQDRLTAFSVAEATQRQISGVRSVAFRDIGRRVYASQPEGYGIRG